MALSRIINSSSISSYIGGYSICHEGRKIIKFCKVKTQFLALTAIYKCSSLR